MLKQILPQKRDGISYWLHAIAAGTKFIPFSSSQIVPASALGSCALAGALRSENDSVLYSSSSSSRTSRRVQQFNFGDSKMVFSASSPHSYKSEFQFSFAQGNKELSIGSSICGTSVDPNPMSGNNNECSSQKMLPSCLVTPIGSSGCALSLLSSSLPDAAATQASHQRDVGTVMPFNPPEPSLLSMSTLHYNQVEPTSSFLAAPGSLPGMFRGGHDGSSASGSQSHHPPPFTWE